MAFSDFDNLILATLCVYLACKIENLQLPYEMFQKFYHDNKDKIKAADDESNVKNPNHAGHGEEKKQSEV